MTKTATTLAILGAGAVAAVLLAANHHDLIPYSLRPYGSEWQLKDSDTPGMVRFTVERRRPGNRWISSSPVRIANFRGLSREMMERGGHAKFQFVQDAGSLVCEGDFSWNGGAGNFRFEPNLRFASELRGMGYQTPSDDQLFSMMFSGVTLEFAGAVREAGLSASTDQLLQLRSHGISTEFIHDTLKAGYRQFSAQDYMDLKSHGVNTWFLRDLRNFGYNLSARDIVQLRSHGVSSEFLADLKGLQPSAGELVQLRSHGVSTDYVRELNDAGYGEIPVRDLVDLNSHGVSARFVREAKEAGYDFTIPELIQLRSHGVDGNYLRHLRETGMKKLSAQQIEKLRTHGVD